MITKQTLHKLRNWMHAKWPDRLCPLDGVSNVKHWHCVLRPYTDDQLRGLWRELEQLNSPPSITLLVAKLKARTGLEGAWPKEDREKAESQNGEPSASDAEKSRPPMSAYGSRMAIPSEKKDGPLF